MARGGFGGKAQLSKLLAADVPAGIPAERRIHARPSDRGDNQQTRPEKK